LNENNDIVLEDVPRPETLEEGQHWVKIKEKPVYQSIDTSFIIASLVKVIQEQQKTIQKLKEVLIQKEIISEEELDN
jgi:hypothetical protein